MPYEHANELLQTVLAELDATQGQVFAERLTPYRRLFRDWSLLQVRRFLLAELGSNDIDLANSIFKSLDDAGHFHDVFDLPTDCVALDASKLEELLVPSGTMVIRWPLLNESYPRAKGFFDAAVPCLNASETSALMYIGQSFGPKMGHGRIWLLHRNDNWTISNVAGVWIA